MPKYFLNVRNGDGFVAADESVTALDRDAVRSLAIRSIREIISEEAKQGRIDLTGQLEICNERGELIEVVPYERAIIVIR